LFSVIAFLAGPATVRGSFSHALAMECGTEKQEADRTAAHLKERGNHDILHRFVASGTGASRSRFARLAP
jgi:hypothetical protein